MKTHRHRSITKWFVFPYFWNLIEASSKLSIWKAPFHWPRLRFSSSELGVPTSHELVFGEASSSRVQRLHEGQGALHGGQTVALLSNQVATGHARWRVSIHQRLKSRCLCLRQRWCDYIFPLYSTLFAQRGMLKMSCCTVCYNDDKSFSILMQSCFCCLFMSRYVFTYFVRDKFYVALHSHTHAHVEALHFLSRRKASLSNGF